MDRKVFQERFGLIGESAALKQVIDKIMQVAPTDITILLQGESGVGKDVTARAIHAMSKRSNKDLVIVNCGAIPEGIIESELFGHEKGAFTGAHEARHGYFEKANGGTIFLDEIGDTPPNVQVKLLRVLETGEFFRVGSSKLKKTDTRVIAATNKDLWELVQSGDFREDLYYRLDTVKIKLPPLRERKEDIIPIFRTFVSEFARKHDSVFQGMSDDAKQLLISYRWPGNIRELRNVAEQLAVLEKSNYVDQETLQKYLKGRQHVGGTDNLPVLARKDDTYQQEHSGDSAKDRELIYRALMELRHDISDMKKMLGNFGSLLYNVFSGGNMKALPQSIQDNSSIDAEEFQYDSESMQPPVEAYPEQSGLSPEEEELREFFGGDQVPSIEETEKFLIQRALQIFEGNRRKASEALGVSERTLYRKLDQYDIS
jgi:DNA-binding NtrC family response regulator